ncbi:hypothetical protein V2A60_006048 [Cordyceps javanica]
MADTVAEASRVINDTDFTPQEHIILADEFANTTFDPTLAAPRFCEPSISGRMASPLMKHCLPSKVTGTGYFD